jgi:hypothetical protein
LEALTRIKNMGFRKVKGSAKGEDPAEEQAVEGTGQSNKCTVCPVRTKRKLSCTRREDVDQVREEEQV